MPGGQVELREADWILEVGDHVDFLNNLVRFVAQVKEIDKSVSAFGTLHGQTETYRRRA